jgi:Heparinase II/III-like protein
MSIKKIFSLVLACWLSTTAVVAQSVERPMIWVKPADKKAIEAKITQQAWAKTWFEAFKQRVEPDLKSHQADVKAYLSKMPLDWSVKDGNVPPMLTFKSYGGLNAEKRQALMHYLQTGIDCGILYFLTDDTQYAQLGADVLNTIIEAMQTVKPAQGRSNSGYIYIDDHLREAREIGAQIPVLYDFIYPFFEKGGLAYHIGKGEKTTFSIPNAEKVFKNYIDVALTQGIINCNWPILEASSLVGNALALNNAQERKDYLQYYLEKNTPNQDALAKVAKFYQDNQNIWPESTNYSGAVNTLTTYLMTLLTKYDPALALGKKYPFIPLAIPTNYYLTYPNKHEMISFGDGHRSYHADYNAYEMAYVLGKLDNEPTLVSEFGALLNGALANNTYKRPTLKDSRSYSTDPYTQPLQLLWFLSNIEGEKKDYPLPTTYNLPFAGIYVQRNLGKNQDPKNGLMCFIGGAAFVHGHASGMNMELYGKGQVLGAESGRGTYQTDLHENYYRLFASHNTVVVNGASETVGGWVNLGINTVQKVAIEPEIAQNPVSPNHSFTTTSFIDDKGDKAEATQERTLAIVRTSATTGYYIDIFRSKSALTPQFHDYIYHNIGSDVDFTPSKKGFKLQLDSLRYKASAAKPWSQNREFRHPGWHFFKEVQTSGVYAHDLTATFDATKLKPEPLKMTLFIAGNNNREYTKVMAPPISDAPKPYDKKPAPAILIRQHGEAWTQPFAVVYEPGEGDKNSVQSVEKVEANGVFKGLKIKSLIDGKKLIQYAFILENSDAIFEDKKLGLRFKGRYAVLTLDEKKAVQSIYIGAGKSLQFKKVTVQAKNGQSGAIYVDFTDKNNLKIPADATFEVKY